MARLPVRPSHEAGDKPSPYILLAASGVLLCTVACGGPAAPPVPTPSEASEALRLAQDAVDKASGYRLEIGAHDLRLPRWGGIDAATLDISGNGLMATGSIIRTGDGTYSVVFADGQTFFRRQTCERFARLPGGGGDAMQPFLWGQTRVLAEAKNARYGRQAATTLEVQADVAPMGAVTMQLEKHTYRPLRLAHLVDGERGNSAWTFSLWGQNVSVSAPGNLLPEKGVGGNPC